MNINLEKLWAGQRGEGSPVKLVGVRGWADGTGENSFARYDDLILAMIEGPAGPAPSISEWRASTDPSWALVVHPINPEGAAQLCEGNHLFGRHLMHGKYLCLGQAEDVHVNRLDAEGGVRERVCGEFGICIHSGGEGMDTGRFSAGCQIIQNPDGYFQDPTWTRFFGPIYDGMVRHGLDTVPYLLTTRGALAEGGCCYDFGD